MELCGDAKAATQTRHEKQSKFELFCKYCHVGYKLLGAQAKHEFQCQTTRRKPSAYWTPIKSAEDGEAGDDSEANNNNDDGGGKVGPG